MKVEIVQVEQLPKTTQEYIERQNTCGICVGDTVKVLRKDKSLANGWSNNWVYAMDETVGQVLVVKSIDKECGIALEVQRTFNGAFGYPYFVLAKWVV